MAIDITKRRLTNFLFNLTLRSRKASAAVALILCAGRNLFLFGFSINSRKNPIPKIAPIAICVELTGSPRVVAIKTVIAEAIATQ